MTKNGIDIVATAFDSLAKTMQLTGADLPKNSVDLSRRRLDRAVIEYAHQMLKSQNLSFDTVRGIFVEGDRVYPTAGFHHKTHSQIAVRNLDCIKGVFRVPANQLQAWDDA